MGNKEKIHGFKPRPNTVDRLVRMDNPLPPEGTPIDINAILKQIQQTRPTLRPRPPKH